MKAWIAAAIVILTLVYPSLSHCETKVFQLSVTIPATASLNMAKASPNKNLNHKAQTQQLARNGKTMMVTSVVVP